MFRALSIVSLLVNKSTILGEPFNGPLTFFSKPEAARAAAMRTVFVSGL